MLEPALNEVGKVVVQKLATLTAEDARQALRSVSRFSAGGVVMVPGLGAFALGVLAIASRGLLPQRVRAFLLAQHLTSH